VAIFRKRVADELVSLFFDGVPNLDLRGLFSAVPLIKKIALTTCQCDAVDALELACSQLYLRALVFSGNPVSKKQFSFAVPQQLTSVVIDDISLASPELFFFLLGALPPPSRLSVRNLAISQTWDAFVEGCKIAGWQISEFCWAGSPIGPAFVALLPKLSFLASLSPADVSRKRTNPSPSALLVSLRSRGFCVGSVFAGARGPSSAARCPLSSQISRTVPSFQKLASLAVVAGTGHPHR
jgi:hypothetical protein